ncbi:MAG TPA: STAS domain-containing protein [Acidimicrobiales bacterium]|jgi:anti-sigma B factor antagonist|nr:STAS domain-containing protein [Acidimicrobiales bacterium]
MSTKEHDFGIVQAKHANGTRMVRPDGELDIATAPALRDFVEELWSDGVDDVFLDLSHLEFIDSRGLGVLVELHRQAAVAHRRLEMGGASPSLSRLFEISGVVHILHLVPVPAYEAPSSPSAAN